MKPDIISMAFISSLALGGSLQVGCAATAHQESTGQYIDDSAITTKVKTKLLHDNVTEGFNISVETYKGNVQLSGFVNSTEVVSRAKKIAESVDGVTKVTNDIQVK